MDQGWSIVRTPIDLVSNSNEIKLSKFMKDNLKFDAWWDTMKQWVVSSNSIMHKKQLFGANPHPFKANPKGKSPIKTL